MHYSNVPDGHFVLLIDRTEQGVVIADFSSCDIAPIGVGGH
jgi:hypothetical protein